MKNKMLVVIFGLVIFLSGCTQSTSTISSSNVVCANIGGMAIESALIDSSRLMLQISNNTGGDISELDVKASFDGGTQIQSNEHKGASSVVSGKTFNISFNEQISSGSHNADIAITYNNGEFTRSASTTCTIRN
ncbi:MAG: hypothetical protein ABIH20_02740 [Candidatus Diapherotrites archaeon]